MTVSDIKDYVVKRSLEMQINPAVPLGIIEQASSWSPSRNHGGKAGLFGIPKQSIVNMATYLADPIAQVDAGLLKLDSLKGKDGTDIDAMKAYFGDSKTAMTALMRGLKMTSEPVPKKHIEAAYKLTGGNSDIQQDARRAGYKFEPDEEPVNVDVPRDDYQQPATDQYQEMKPPAKKLDLIKVVFEQGAEDSDIPADVISQLESFAEGDY